jgi:DNA-directed RNA polymerase subunit H (RpoH/RPB5)
MFDESRLSEIELKVTEVFIEDVGKGLARFDPDDVKALGASLGDVVEIIRRKNIRDFPRTYRQEDNPD